MELKLHSGLDFTETDQRLADSENINRPLLINESAAKALGWTPDGHVLFSTDAFSLLPNRQLVSLDPATNTSQLLPLAQASQGVIDPVKVVRSALQDAASVAGLLITTEAMIAEKPKKEAGGAPQMPGGMDGAETFARARAGATLAACACS